MARFIIDLWLDGYETPEEMNEACISFIDEQLDISASSVGILGQIEEQDDESTFILYGGNSQIVQKQLTCEHIWSDPCMDNINRFCKCTKCYCMKYDCTWEDYLKLSKQDNS